MTTPSDKSNLTNQLWENSEINNVEFNGKDFSPSLNGHGLFVKTNGNDTLIDLRLSMSRPFLGHSHPILTQFKHNMLENESLENHYSVPKQEFASMIELFQIVNFSKVLDPKFEITYHNVVINIDEEILTKDTNDVRTKITNLIVKNPETYFWIVENDIVGLNPKNIFFFENLLIDPKLSKQVHLVLDNYFIDSVWIYSKHLFSSDKNEQLFLSLDNYYNKIVSHKDGKNQIDFLIIDDFLKTNIKVPYSRVGRYLIFQDKINKDKLTNNGILSSEINSSSTIFNFPIACTKSELLDTLKRILLTIT